MEKREPLRPIHGNEISIAIMGNNMAAFQNI
jgi:hypothetical protein